MSAKRLMMVVSMAIIVIPAFSQQVATVVTNGLNQPFGVVHDGNGNILIADSFNNRIMKYNISGASLSPFCGNTMGEAGAVNDPSSPFLSKFDSPQAIIAARGGYLVADYNNHLIRYVGANGIATNMVGSSPLPGDSVPMATASAVTLRYPTALARNPEDGNVFIADSMNNSVLVLFTNNMVTNLVNWNNITNVIVEPTGIAIGTNGQIWISDMGNNVIWLIETTNSGMNVTVLPNKISIKGGSLGVSGFKDDLIARNGKLNRPRGLLWIDGTGLLICDTGNHAIRKLRDNVQMGGYALETLAGVPGQPGTVDGTFDVARFNNPVGFGRDEVSGDIYIADRGSSKIRRIQTTKANQPPVPDPIVGIITNNVITGQFFIQGVETIIMENSDKITAISGGAGSDTIGAVTRYTYGPTPTNVLDTISIPDPINSSGTSPTFQNGSRTLPNASLFTPAPDITVKARSFATGRDPSQIISARFIYQVGSPLLIGDDYSGFIVSNNTLQCKIYYTTNGLDPDKTNSLLLPMGERLYFPDITHSLLVKIRAYRDDFKPSEIVNKSFFPLTNAVGNKLTLGFESGEASSAFMGSPGQTFFVPVTLSLLSGFNIYSLGFGIAINPLSGSADFTNSAQELAFQSMLLKPMEDKYVVIPNVMIGATTTVTNINSSTNVVGLLTNIVVFPVTNIYINGATLVTNVASVTNITGLITNVSSFVVTNVFSNATALVTNIVSISNAVSLTKVDLLTSVSVITNAFGIITNVTSSTVTNYYTNLLGLFNFYYTNILHLSDVGSVVENVSYITYTNMFASVLGTTTNVLNITNVYYAGGSVITNITFNNATNYFTNVLGVTTNTVYTTNTIFIPALSLFTNMNNGSGTMTNLIGISWLEMPGATNLYDSKAQDLVTYSMAHTRLYNKNSGNVILGSFSFRIPTNAAVGSPGYQVQALNASASTGRGSGISLLTPVIGAASAYKEVKLTNVSYLVGDVSHFRWLNAGDFGDHKITMDDVATIFMVGVYKENMPPQNSDFYDAMDACNGNIAGLTNIAMMNLDTMTNGDGNVDVADVFVTLRRSIDYNSKWWARYWSNGVQNFVTNANTLQKPIWGDSTGDQIVLGSGNPAGAKLNVYAGNASISGLQAIVPIVVEIYGELPVRALMFNASVLPVPGTAAPGVQSVQFVSAQTAALGQPLFQDSRANSYAAAWVDIGSLTGLTGRTNILGQLIVNLTSTPAPDAAYMVKFDHFSASPNGLMVFPKNVLPGFINPKVVVDKLHLLSKAMNIPGTHRKGVNLQYLTPLGLRYIIESSERLNGSPWSGVVTGSGDGLFQEFIETNTLDKSRFYRLRIAE